MATDEHHLQENVKKLESLKNNIDDKEKQLSDISVKCEELKTYPDLETLATTLLEQLKLILVIISEHKVAVLNHIELLRVKIQEMDDKTIDSGPMPEEIISPKKVCAVETQTSTSPEKKVETKDVSITCIPPVDIHVQTEPFKEAKPCKETLHILKTVSGDQETIQISSKPITSTSEPIIEEPDDLLVKAEYKDKQVDEQTTSELNIQHSAPFETVFIEPDETTTEVIVDADGTKRIIVRKLRKTVVSRQQTVQQQQLTTLNTLSEGDVPVSQSFSQVTLQGQQSSTTVAKDGKKETLSSQNFGGKVISSIPGGELNVHEFQMEPKHEFTVEEFKKPSEVEIEGVKLHEGDVTFVDDKNLTLIPSEGKFTTVEGEEYHTSTSSVRAVVQQVTRRIIKRTRRIIKRVTIIDGKEHVTEEIVEDPEDIDVTEQEIPRVSINVMRTEDGRIVQEQHVGEQPSDFDPEPKVTKKSSTEIIEIPAEEVVSTQKTPTVETLTADFISREQIPLALSTEATTVEMKTPEQSTTSSMVAEFLVHEQGEKAVDSKPAETPYPKKIDSDIDSFTEVVSTIDQASSPIDLIEKTVEILEKEKVVDVKEPKKLVPTVDQASSPVSLTEEKVEILKTKASPVIKELDSVVPTVDQASSPIMPVEEKVEILKKVKSPDVKELVVSAVDQASSPIVFVEESKIVLKSPEVVEKISEKVIGQGDVPVETPIKIDETKVPTHPESPSISKRKKSKKREVKETVEIVAPIKEPEIVPEITKTKPDVGSLITEFIEAEKIVAQPETKVLLLDKGSSPISVVDAKSTPEVTQELVDTATSPILVKETVQEITSPKDIEPQKSVGVIEFVKTIVTSNQPTEEKEVTKELVEPIVSQIVTEVIPTTVTVTKITQETKITDITPTTEVLPESVATEIKSLTETASSPVFGTQFDIKPEVVDTAVSPIASEISDSQPKTDIPSDSTVHTQIFVEPSKPVGSFVAEFLEAEKAQASPDVSRKSTPSPKEEMNAPSSAQIESKKQPAQMVEFDLSVEEKPAKKSQVTPKVAVSMKVEKRDKPAFEVVKKEIDVTLPPKTEIRDIKTTTASIALSPIIPKTEDKHDDTSTSEYGGRRSRKKKKHKEKEEEIEPEKKISQEEIIVPEPSTSAVVISPDGDGQEPVSVETSLAESTEIIIAGAESLVSDTPRFTEEVFDSYTSQDRDISDKDNDTGYEADSKAIFEDLSGEEGGEEGEEDKKKKRKRKRRQKVQIVESSEETHVPKSTDFTPTPDEGDATKVAEDELKKGKKKKKGKKDDSKHSEHETEEIEEPVKEEPVKEEPKVKEAEIGEIVSPVDACRTISELSEPGEVKIIEEQVIISPQSEVGEIQAQIVVTVPIFETTETLDSTIQTSPDLSTPQETPSETVPPKTIPTETISSQTSPEIPLETTDTLIQTDIVPEAPKVETVELSTQVISTEVIPVAEGFSQTCIIPEKVEVETTEISMQTASPVRIETQEEEVQVTAEDVPRTESAMQTTVVDLHEEVVQTITPEPVVKVETTEFSIQTDQPEPVIHSELSMQTSPEPIIQKSHTEIQTTPVEFREEVVAKPVVETVETIAQTTPVVIKEIGEETTSKSPDEPYEIHIHTTLTLPGEDSREVVMSKVTTGKQIPSEDSVKGHQQIVLDTKPAKEPSIDNFGKEIHAAGAINAGAKPEHYQSLDVPLTESMDATITVTKVEVSQELPAEPPVVSESKIDHKKSPKPKKKHKKAKSPLPDSRSDSEDISIHVTVQGVPVDIKPKTTSFIDAEKQQSEGYVPSDKPRKEDKKKKRDHKKPGKAPEPDKKAPQVDKSEKIEPQKASPKAPEISEPEKTGPQLLDRPSYSDVAKRHSRPSSPVPESASESSIVENLTFDIKKEPEKITSQDTTEDLSDTDTLKDSSEISINVSESKQESFELVPPFTDTKELLITSPLVEGARPKESSSDLIAISKPKPVEFVEIKSDSIPEAIVSPISSSTDSTESKAEPITIQASIQTPFHEIEKLTIEIDNEPVQMPSDSKTKSKSSKPKPKSKYATSVTIEEVMSPTEVADVPITPGSEGPLSPPNLSYPSSTTWQPSKTDSAMFIEAEKQPVQHVAPPQEVNVKWKQTKAIERIKNLQNAKRTTHLCDVLYLATLNEIVTDESIQQRNNDVQQNLNVLKEAVEKQDVVVIQHTIITTVETITTWLETIEYRIYLNRQQTGKGPSEERLKEFGGLKEEIENIGQSVAQLEGALNNTGNLHNEDDKEKMEQFITSLQQQIKVIEEVTEENEQQAAVDLNRWVEFVNGVSNITRLVNEVKQQLETVSESESPPSCKLKQLEELENMNRCHMLKTVHLMATARGLMRDFPSREVPQEMYNSHEQTKLIDHIIGMERDKVLQLLSLADEYEQTLQEFAQITDIADALVEEPISVINLEHLQEEMQKHRKFFVNLSHCRSILESLEGNLDSETRAKHSNLHRSLHERATIILDKAASRSQQMALAASRWTVLEQGMREETRWLQVAQQRVPDLSTVTSADYDQYINLYQSLSIDIAHHYAKLSQLNGVAQRLKQLVNCTGIEQTYEDALEVIMKLQEDVNNNLHRLIAFRETWCSYNLLTDKVEYWMREAEQELANVESQVPQAGNMRQFWELKAQYEVHNSIRTEAGNTFEQAMNMVPVADEMLQRQFRAELQDRWQNVTTRINDINKALIENISAPDIPVNEKLIILEAELHELKVIVEDLHGIIKSEEELSLYIERLQVMSERIDTIQNELGKLGLLSAAESETVGFLLTLSKRLEIQISDELESANLLKEKLKAIKRGLSRVRRNHEKVSKILDDCELCERKSSDVVEKAVSTEQFLLNLWLVS